jgi:ferrous iron transport protein B
VADRPGAAAALPPSLARDLLTEGVLSGVGSVVVFLPQIVILFFFILAMEASGYMARAAFLMDRLMAGVGLSGRSFIPLLSSFACAIPGIMATRSITDPKDRLTTILIAPLMTCSARLPVYAVIIAAFIPNRPVARCRPAGAGAVRALRVRDRRRDGGRAGAAPFGDQGRGQRLHHGTAQVPDAAPRRPADRRCGSAPGSSCAARARSSSWSRSCCGSCSTSPSAAPGESQVDASIAGKLANGLAVVVEPIGFNRDIALSLIPAMAAREVAVSSLATTYAVGAGDDEEQQAKALGDRLKARTGACPPRWPSSPGSSSRRSA